MVVAESFRIGLNSIGALHLDWSDRGGGIVWKMGRIDRQIELLKIVLEAWTESRMNGIVMEKWTLLIGESTGNQRAGF